MHVTGGDEPPSLSGRDTPAYDVARQALVAGLMKDAASQQRRAVEDDAWSWSVCQNDDATRWRSTTDVHASTAAMSYIESARSFVTRYAEVGAGPTPAAAGRAFSEGRGAIMRPVSALPSLSSESQRSLDRSIEGALRYRSGARARLRDVVRTVIDELRVAGATGEGVRAALAGAVDRHPATGRLDRTSLITGAHSSTMITELILTWVDDSVRIE